MIIGRTKSCTEELHKLYSSLNIIKLINSRRVRWARHVPRMREGEERKGVQGVFIVNPERKRLLGIFKRR
jgi:hypothetical protein